MPANMSVHVPMHIVCSKHRYEDITTWAITTWAANKHRYEDTTHPHAHMHTRRCAREHHNRTRM